MYLIYNLLAGCIFNELLEPAKAPHRTFLYIPPPPPFRPHPKDYPFSDHLESFSRIPQGNLSSGNAEYELMQIKEDVLEVERSIEELIDNAIRLVSELQRKLSESNQLQMELPFPSPPS